ncbi:MAG: hypothetical protein WC223_13035 [Bacteroidales bacterium]|jgi:hypothetical protein
MKSISFLYVSLLLCSIIACNTTKNIKLTNENQILSELKKDLISKLLQKNNSVDTSIFEVNYYPLLVNRRHKGIYTYSRIGSHASRKNFFCYKEGNITILNYLDSTVFYNTVEKFLNKNKFSKKDIINCKQKLTNIINDNTPLSF